MFPLLALLFSRAKYGRKLECLIEYTSLLHFDYFRNHFEPCLIYTRGIELFGSK